MSYELKFYSLQTLIARICASIKSPNTALWSLILQKNTIFLILGPIILWLISQYFMAYVSDLEQKFSFHLLILSSLNPIKNNLCYISQTTNPHSSRNIFSTNKHIYNRNGESHSKKFNPGRPGFNFTQFPGQTPSSNSTIYA